MINEKIINLNLGLFSIRLALAAVFMVHGLAKLTDMAGTVAFFSQIGLGSFLAYLVALAEVAAGTALLFGVFTVWAGIILAVNMLTAILLVKFSLGFIGGYEFDLTLLLASIGIALAGPGEYTIKKL